ncbi:MAG: GntR family transcriptional regulator [Lentisphaeria bacterium]|nr:MAG: GntR family transcriptional regulator [Lentisphaeria bacterium]
MKIRRYVLNLIATGGDMPQRIPSSRKLGEMFGVTHPTALRAIQALTEDGYLQPLRGRLHHLPGKLQSEKHQAVWFSGGGW